MNWNTVVQKGSKNINSFWRYYYSKKTGRTSNIIPLFTYRTIFIITCWTCCRPIFGFYFIIRTLFITAPTPTLVTLKAWTDTCFNVNYSYYNPKKHGQNANQFFRKKAEWDNKSLLTDDKWHEFYQKHLEKMHKISTPKFQGNRLIEPFPSYLDRFDE